MVHWRLEAIATTDMLATEVYAVTPHHELELTTDEDLGDRLIIVFHLLEWVLPMVLYP